MDQFDSQSDAQLVELLQADRSSASRPFETLVRRHQQFVVGNCRFITRAPNDAEDLAQEVFVKAFFGLRRFEQRTNFRSWLHRIKVNHCLNHLRKTRGAVMVDADDEAVAAESGMTTPASGEAALQALEQRELIARVLERMSDTLRIPLILRDADGLSYDEIATELGLSLSAVKMRIKRAREEFRRVAGSRLQPPAPARAHESALSEAP